MKKKKPDLIDAILIVLLIGLCFVFPPLGIIMLVVFFAVYLFKRI